MPRFFYMLNNVSGKGDKCMDKETEKMLEILHQNYLKERDTLQKKGHKSQKIVLLIIGLILIILCFICINALNKDFVKRCTSVGYSKDYCINEINK